MNVPTTHRDILKNDVKAFAFLGTLMPDGSPQVTPIWFNWDGEDVYFNTARGRVKDENIQERPRVALSILDPHNPYRYVHLRGRAVEVTDKDARDHINFLSKKYTGDPNYAGDPAEERVMYRLQAEHVNVYG